MTLRTIQENPETGINIVCLIISAVAPSLAIGPAVGLPTGGAIALGLIAVIRAQRHASGSVRRQYYVGAWFIRIFAGCFEQMAYCDQFAQRPTLPFSLDAIAWAWIATVFMAAIDLWAYQATASKAAARADEKAEEDSYARIERMQQEKERAETERRILEKEEKLELAKIQAEAEKQKAAEVARQEAEARKFEAEKAAEIRKAEAETTRKQAEIEAETKRKQAEEGRKRAEIKAEEARQKAEADRKQAEMKRKEQEENRKRAEEKRKEAEAEKVRLRAAEAEFARIEMEKQKAMLKQAEVNAEMKTRWAEADPETRKQLITEAETKLTHVLNRKPIQAEIAEELGTTDRTIRNYLKAA